MAKVIYRKTGLLACLFCFYLAALAQRPASDWQFEEKSLSAYHHVLNLQFQQATALLHSSGNVQDLYVLSLAESLELLLNEDADKFNEYEIRFQRRIEKLEGRSPDIQFIQAELHLHWAFVYLKFGHELDAARHLREAYRISDECRKQHPSYLAIKKTSGVLEMLIGSVPTKYNWILTLLNMQGSMERGIAELNEVSRSDSPLALEAALLLSLAKGYIFQQPDAGLKSLTSILDRRPDNRLVLFAGASVAIKSANSKEALTLLQHLQSLPGPEILFSHYLLGEVLLHKGDYPSAIASYKRFISYYKGQNNLKDAYFKVGICHLLNGATTEAQHAFEEAKVHGTTVVEADKSAARALSEERPPPVALSRARYAMDGGFYAESRAILNDISDNDLPEKRFVVEYYYRKARLEHVTRNYAAAKLFYRQVIDMAGNESWYFAPNACLQLGYLAIESRDHDSARKFFKRALSYNRHEYKNSIDSKARSALAQLKETGS